MKLITRPETIPAERLAEIKVYEYTDLGILEQKLDFMLGTSVLEPVKRQRKTSLVPYPMTVDIETTTLPAGSMHNKTEHPVALPYLYQVYIAGTVFIFRYDHEFRHFIDYLEELLLIRQLSIVCYIHNASFEWQFFKSRLSINMESVFALQSRRIGKFDTERGGIIFRCSYLLSNMSLEKFAENYNPPEYRKDKELIDYEIPRFPWTDLDNEILYYACMDVICLYHAVMSIMQREGDNIKTIPMTNTGYVRRSCRLACLGENTSHYKSEAAKKTYIKYRNYKKMFQKCAPNYKQYQILRKAFRGGNTHANRFKIGAPISDVDSFDFSSSYPAAIVAYDGYPMGKLMECTNSLKTADDISYYCRRYWCVITVVFKDLRLRDPYNTLCPYIPISKCTREWVTDQAGRRQPRNGSYDNGRLLSQDGYTEFTFLSCEWDIIRKQYSGEFKVKEAYYTPMGYLPDALRSQCYEWFKAKTELKNVDGFEYEYMKSKNRVNSVYGMMVEQIIKLIMTVDDNGGITSRQPTDEEAEQQIEEFLKPRNRKFLLYQWGVTVTAICRVRHMEIIEMFGRDFVYGDTDSVKAENASLHLADVEAYNERWVTYARQAGVPIEAVTKDGENQILGFLDYEQKAHATEFRTLGAKKYAYTGDDGKLHLTVAGVPKSAGARLLGSIDNFVPGFVFHVSDGASLSDRQSWKKLLTYRDDLNETWNIDGHDITLKTCIAMERTEYNLSITEEFEALTGYHDKFGKEEIYEEDPDIWQ